MWKLHCLPEAIVSDRGPQFTDTFRLELCLLLKVQPHLSTTIHPQTDGQTEKANAVMQEYLRSYFSYQQEDCAALQGMAEFTGNNHVLETTGSSPFLANLGYHPRMNFPAPARALDRPLPRLIT